MNNNNKHVWIITRVNWEYNDEYHYRSSDYGTGTPEAYYLTPETAQTACDEMNKKERASGNWKPENFEYGSDENESLDGIDFYEVIKVPLGS